MSLAPPLTDLDRAVLAALEPERTMAGRPAPSASGVRLDEVARRARTTTDEAREILRGFEHLGYVQQRGGWWRRCA